MATVSDASVTIIGESVQVRGNLSGDEDLHVLGRIEGSLELERTLVVAQSGIVKAEVSVRNAVISGIVVGNITASESVEITREGRMVGDISSPRVIIVDGASFRGNVDMGDVANMPARLPRRERPEVAPVPRAAKAKIEKPEKREETKAPAADQDRTTVVQKAPEAAPAKASIDDKPQARAASASPAAARATTTTTTTTTTTAPAPARPAESRPASSTPGKKPGFLNPPKAKGLPKKSQKSRVVVKRR